MIRSDSKRKGGYSGRIGQAGLVVVVCAAVLYPFSTAEAGILDRVKDIYQLPEQMDQMEKQYEATKQQLQEQTDKLAETVRQSKEAEERLMAQNKLLLEQNAALQRSLQETERDALEKEARNRKLIIMGITAVLLVAGYFVTGRFVRVAVWRRQKGNLRK
jgi:septal ring factor EnvC (AmiA/AmiB activator)